VRLFAVVQIAIAPPSSWPPVPAHYTPCPGDVTRVLVRFDIGDQYGAETALRGMPGVVVLPETFLWANTMVPAMAVTMFGSWGVIATDTLALAARKIRAAWPYFHP
jgi:hypothetical protein